MIRTSALVSLLLLSAAAGAADKPAATEVARLTSLEGTVLVSAGAKFVTPDVDQALSAGDRILVMEGANAIVTFADGCALPIASGSQVVIPAASTCSGAVAQTSQTHIQVAQGGGRFFMTNPIVIAGVIATAIAVPVAIHNSRHTSP